ncbi:3',5'-nucleoside bisphosphate phosphatase [Methylotenera sp.]|uniref:3',5'-nucleoside bisphosphate phosphatase n=1 Tax=Methylotenera sp. TaxID=2051956 RepID=UPI00248A1896|nr:3',5'-nucleoside bisphosphate phosphatase [Methylotenera sp.]MDI1298582.1 PHP domain-containing protein [Methylotenera sp.]
MSLTFDLHSHTTISDGMLSPNELVAYAANQGVDVLALTDHDDTGGLAIAAEEAKRWGLHFINGVEISVTWKKRTIHIVGLKINPEHPELRAGLAALRAGRHKRAEGMAASLDKVGITGSLEGAYQYVNDGIIGRIHFARFLVESGVSKDNKAVFKKYLVKGKPGYFEHQWASLEEAIRWIVDSGGVAVLAHPGRYDLGRTNMLLLLEEFRALGGTAIEVVTGSHTGAHYVEFAKYAQMFSLKSSVGTDYHGKGVSFMEMGRLPALPSNCLPIWQDWPEALLTSTNITKNNTAEITTVLI